MIQYGHHILLHQCMSLRRMFLITFFSVISTIIVICIATPIFIVVILPLGIVYFLVQVGMYMYTCEGPWIRAGLLSVPRN